MDIETAGDVSAADALSDASSDHARLEGILARLDAEDTSSSSSQADEDGGVGTPPSTSETGEQRQRDERGRFVSTKPDTDSPADEADAIAAKLDGDTEAPDTETAEVEPAEPAIEPPSTLSAELKEKFKGLAPDVQQAIAQFETERQTGVSRKLNEAAELRKAADAEKQAAATERQRYAQAIDHALSLSHLPAIIREGQQLDWLKLAQEDKALYVEKRAQFDHAVQEFSAHQAERQRIAAQQQAELVQAETAKAVEAIPELRDATKAKEFATGVQAALRDYGFSDPEIANLADHRILKVLRDVMAFRAEKAARAAAAAKAKAPQAPKVSAPAKGEQRASDPKAAQDAAILKRARAAGSIGAKADLLARLF